MRVDRGIASCAGQVLVLTVWNVEVRLRISVFLGQTKVDHVDLVTALANAHDKVIGLDIALLKFRISMFRSCPENTRCEKRCLRHCRKVAC